MAEQGQRLMVKYQKLLRAKTKKRQDDVNRAYCPCTEESWHITDAICQWQNRDKI